MDVEGREGVDGPDELPPVLLGAEATPVLVVVPAVVGCAGGRRSPGIVPIAATVATEAWRLETSTDRSEMAAEDGEPERPPEEVAAKQAANAAPASTTALMIAISRGCIGSAART